MKFNQEGNFSSIVKNLFNINDSDSYKCIYNYVCNLRDKFRYSYNYYKGMVVNEILPALEKSNIEDKDIGDSIIKINNMSTDMIKDFDDFELNGVKNPGDVKNLKTDFVKDYCEECDFKNDDEVIYEIMVNYGKMLGYKKNIVELSYILNDLSVKFGFVINGEKLKNIYNSESIFEEEKEGLFKIIYNDYLSKINERNFDELYDAEKPVYIIDGEYINNEKFKKLKGEKVNLNSDDKKALKAKQLEVKKELENKIFNEDFVNLNKSYIKVMNIFKSKFDDFENILKEYVSGKDMSGYKYYIFKK